jgi:putative hemolysin
MKKITIVTIVTLGVMLAGFYVLYTQSFSFKKNSITIKTTDTSTSSQENVATSNTSPVGIANPASSNCVKNGGTVVIQKHDDGGEYGLCFFDDNRACEEWAMLRGDCPVGGRKTTGYDTIDQKYCAWVGGNTTAITDSKCTFKNGKVCGTKDFYEGKCSSSF